MSEINPLLYFNTPQDVIDVLVAFAQNEPAISRLTLFGSRVSGRRRYKPNPTIIPDLDVAYELNEAVCEELKDEPQEVASKIGRAFKALKLIASPSVDLQYLTEGMTICSYVAGNGLVIFERPDIKS